MVDYPMTYAEFAKVTPDLMAAGVINAALEDNPLLAMLPIVPWTGGKSVTWNLTGTLPTVSAIDETSAMTATKSVRKSLSSYLSQYGGDIQESVFIQSTMDAANDSEAEDIADLGRAMGAKLRSEVIKGNWMTEANVTIIPNVAATPGVDAVIAVSANMPMGYGWLKYTHVGTLLAFRAPGSTTYGAGVAVSDANIEFADGDDTSKKVTLTIDASDYTAGAANLEGGTLLFQRPEEMAGLKELAALDSAQVITPSTNGDAVSLVLLDQLTNLCKGPNSEKVLIANERTVRNLMALYRAAGGATPADLKREVMVPGLLYGPDGIPIVKCPDVVITETQGTSASSCGRIYCVRLNKSRGLHLFYGLQRGPNSGTKPSTDDSDVSGATVPLPVYLRRLNEADGYAVYKWRITAAVCLALRCTQSCAMAYGITN